MLKRFVGGSSIALAGASALALMLAASTPIAAQTTKKSGKTPGIDVVADQIVFDSTTNVATADGTVVMHYGKYTITAHGVRYNTVAKKFVAMGNVIIRDDKGLIVETPLLNYDQKTDTYRTNKGVKITNANGDVMEAPIMEMRNAFQQGFAEHVRLLLTNDVTITATYAQRIDGNISVYTNATYTACKTCVSKNGTPVWQIRGTKVTHNKEDKNLYIENARLEIGGVPVFWSPYMVQPDPSVKRRSGFLLPNIRYTKMYGAGLEIPYFFNLAPNYDLTVLPIINTRQTPIGQFEWRHRLDKGSYNIEGAGVYELKHEKGYVGKTRYRGSIATQGDFELVKNWNWGWHGELASDRTFLGAYDLSRRGHARSDIYAKGIDGRNFYSAEVIHYRDLLDRENRRLVPQAVPYAQMSWYEDDPVFGGELKIDASSYYVTRNHEGTPFKRVSQGRDQMRTSAAVHWQRQIVSDSGLLVTPSAEVRGDVYYTKKLPDWEGDVERKKGRTTARILPTGGLDARYPLVSDSSLGQSILTPVAQIFASTNETDRRRIGNEDAVALNFDYSSLFLQDRFTGIDRFEGGVRANAGFLYTLLTPGGGALRLTGGESFHIAGRNSFNGNSGLRKSASNLVGGVAFEPNGNFRLSYQLRVDEKLSHVNTQEVAAGLNYSWLSTTINYAVASKDPYYGRNEKGDQVWGSARVALFEGWALGGGLRYDFREKQFRSHEVSLFFDCECMNFALTYKNDYQYERDVRGSATVLATIKLKTIGTVGANSGL